LRPSKKRVKLEIIRTILDRSSESQRRRRKCQILKREQFFAFVRGQFTKGKGRMVKGAIGRCRCVEKVAREFLT